ncbi:MAG: glycosyltransferase [Mangrovicoccus sp.]
MSVIWFDASRLISRRHAAGPTGIDQVELSILRTILQTPELAARTHVMRQWQGRLWDVPQSVMRRMLKRLTRRWIMGETRRRWPLPGLLSRPPAGGLYLNLSHQGLEKPWLLPHLTGRGMRASIYLHDLIPIAYPETTRPEQPERHHQRIQNIVQSGARITCASDQTRRDLITHCTAQGWECPDVAVAPPPVDVPLVYGGKGGKDFFLAVGTLEPRKNYDFLAQIWQSQRSLPQLLIIGQKGWQGQEIANRLAEVPGIRVMTGLNSRQVVQLMHDATALLQPSMAEGWGLPPVEALTLGTPAITADLPIYHESLRGHHLGLPFDPRAWAEALTELGDINSDLSRHCRANAVYFRPVPYEEAVTEIMQSLFR